MARGFVHLAVVLDSATRRVLSWLSITMEAAFCVEILEDALARHGRPEIFNTDQGSQFTGAAFTAVLAGNCGLIAINLGIWGIEAEDLKRRFPPRPLAGMTPGASCAPPEEYERIMSSYCTEVASAA